MSIEIKIKIFEETKTLFGAEIFINGEWFKEISGLPTKKDVVRSIGQNEDLLNSIENNDYD